MQLESTLANLRQANRHAVFLKVPMIQSHYIVPSRFQHSISKSICLNFVLALLREKGFRYHHAEGDKAVLMMWLPSGDCKVPKFATHHCGVGGVVLSGDNVLVVKEHPPYNKHWKFPGGYAELGEDFGDAAVREVWEETGVRASFSHVLTMRHSHEEQFGRSNLYVVCVLHALTTDILLDAEIEAAQWMPLDSFRNALAHSPMTSLVTDLVIERNAGMKEIHMQYPLAGRLPFKLYHSSK
jgi:ADP-ribose pyrophosphatase YjhB (NUDIX family)